jgi:hypothetical protein
MARPNAFAQPEWKEKAFGRSVQYGFSDARPIKAQREGLPIFAFRDDILQGIQEHRILILSAETGSGKTTQVTQYLAEAGWTSKARPSFRCVAMPHAPSAAAHSPTVFASDLASDDAGIALAH